MYHCGDAVGGGKYSSSLWDPRCAYAPSTTKLADAAGCDGDRRLGAGDADADAASEDDDAAARALAEDAPPAEHWAASLGARGLLEDPSEKEYHDAYEVTWIRVYDSVKDLHLLVDCDFELESGEAALCPGRSPAGSRLCLGDVARLPKGLDICTEPYVEEPRTFAYALNSAGDFDKYQTAAAYDGMIDVLADRDGASLIPSIATTVEGRKIRGVQVGTGSRVLVVTCGLHAREWAGIAGCFHALDTVTKDPAKYGFGAGLRLVAFPLVNADGYEYSRTTYRYQRGNRNTKDAEAKGCSKGSTGWPGVDLNRNFDGLGKWGTAGVSHNPCDPQVYCGKAAFDQRETEGLRDYMLELKAEGADIYAAVDQHTYSALMLYPPGHCYLNGQYPQCPDDMPDFSEAEKLGTEMAAACSAVPNAKYYTPTYGTLLYPTSGTSIDFYADVTSTGFGSAPR
jgi:hypothetical protein